MKRITVTFNKLELNLVISALNTYLEIVTEQLQVLKIAKERDLTMGERNLLPWDFKDMGEQDLQVFIIPWENMIQRTTYLREYLAQQRG